MALFRRNKVDDSTGMPDEINSYYQAEKRERSWMAWVLALGTLAVTAIVIIGLFFGGRWVYRKVRKTPDTTTSVVTQQPVDQKNTDKKPDENKDPKPQTSGSTATPGANTPAPQQPSGSVNAPANPSANAGGTTVPGAAANTDLPNTGPGDMLAVFAVVSVAAYVLHRRLVQG